MAAGQLRELVTFQRRSAASDGMGNTRAAWADISGCTSRPARIRPVKQSEISLADGVQGREVYEITVRATSALAAVMGGDRMIDARNTSRAFNVKGRPLNLDERGRFLRFTVESGGADG